ncbi:NAD(P)-dependent oxidoreductase [Amycolatopsis sp. lyj-90]|uniref:NAD(P)-dependent oxidoreductase n=1 Tax=Amycolatopsis sp. lyj-90 TaxID=2789285 RepID=UPI00397A6F69
MPKIAVIGGTGYAGSAIAAEAAARGHQVTSLSRSLPDTPIADVSYVQGDVSDEEPLAATIAAADVVVGAIAPRGSLSSTFRDVYGTIARLADAAEVPLFVVGGYSSLRPAPGADRFVSDLSRIPPKLHGEILAGSALIIEDLPATPETLDWVFVSPALRFGARMPSDPLGHYRLGDDIAVQPGNGGLISAADYALGFVDLIEKGGHHRAHVNLGNAVESSGSPSS